MKTPDEPTVRLASFQVFIKDVVFIAYMILGLYQYRRG